MQSFRMILIVMLTGWSIVCAGEVKPSALIEVEVRFIEFEQDAMEKLGLQGLISTEPDGAVTNTSNQEKRDKARRNASSANVPPAGVGAMSISSVLNAAQLEHVLHTLKQGNGVNLIAAPKVTTESGKEAEIKVVEEVRYPVEYEIQAVEQDVKTGTMSRLSSNSTASASNKVMTVLGVSKFETRETGVILNVTPVLEPDGETIHLSIYPRVVELVNWVDYGYTVTNSDGSSQKIELLQPIFSARSLDSQVSVRDGQTLIMGGMITEIRQVVEKEVPLLVDIPLLGRLFKKKTEKNIIRNSIIMVTARKKPD